MKSTSSPPRRAPLSTAQLQGLLQPDLDLLDLARLIRTVATENTGATLAFVSTVDPATGTLISHTHLDAFATMPSLAESDRRMVFHRNQQGRYPALLGHALNTLQAFYTNDAPHHPASTGVPPGHVAIRSFLAAPALDNGRAVGLIGLANSPVPFTDDDLDTLKVLAEIYTVSIRRTRHYDDLKISHLALESLAIGVVTTTLLGDVLSVNEAFTTLSGWSADEILGKNLRLLQGPGTDQVEVARLRSQVAACGAMRCELLNYRRDGTPFWNSLSITSVRVSDEKLVLVGVMEDVSARRATEKGLRELEVLYQQSQKLESLGQLASGVAHDVNNVLSAIGTVASRQVLQLSPGDPSLKALTTIEKAVERGGALTTGLLNFVRKKPGLTQAVAWNQVITEHLELLRYTTLSRVSFRVELDPNLEAIDGEVESLGHVLMNLCLNALDSMKNTSRESVLLITSRQNATRVVIEVTDNGEGMDPDVRAHALEPFFTTKAPHAGTGLGLALALRVVESHGGHLEIDSEVGHGTTVRMSFPAAEASVAPTKFHAEVTVGPSGRRILLVDDDDLVRENLRELLETLGFHVEEASDGLLALDRLGRGELFDLVLLDMNMPKLSGAATLVQLRKQRPHLPVIISTGLADQSVLDLVASTPHTKLLRKPLLLSQLRELLNA